LGDKVDMTKASGDQGIDLILTAPGRRSGIQAKGYTDNVGNSSVQEAYAGRVFSSCDSCAVVTNSDFTPAARGLAARVGCALINGTQIPTLIEGGVRL
jgi:restriction system protein